MVHIGTYCPLPSAHVPQPVQQQQHAVQQSDFEQQSYDEDDDGLVALTPEEAGITDTLSLHDSPPNEASLQDFLQPTCVRCAEDQTQVRDKENVPPSYHHQHGSGCNAELTYLDLDKSSPSVVLRERGAHPTDTGTGVVVCLKRRRAVTEWETEEAVMSILPKRSKHPSPEPAAADSEDEGDDSVFLDEAALFSDCVARQAATASGVDRNSPEASSTNSSSSAMEIDRITSLVSIFSFGGLTVSSSAASGGGGTADGLGKLSRSMSTPDLCSAQAKESAVDALQQRPFLAMTV